MGFLTKFFIGVNIGLLQGKLKKISVDIEKMSARVADLEKSLKEGTLIGKEVEYAEAELALLQANMELLRREAQGILGQINDAVPVQGNATEMKN